jgi:hypothetical protein
LSGILKRCPNVKALALNLDRGLMSRQNDFLRTRTRHPHYPPLLNLTSLTFCEVSLPDDPSFLLNALSPNLKRLEIASSAYVNRRDILARMMKRLRLQDFLQGLSRLRSLEEDFELVMNGQVALTLPAIASIDVFTLKNLAVIDSSIHLPRRINCLRIQCLPSLFDHLIDLIKKQAPGHIRKFQIEMRTVGQVVGLTLSMG